MRFHQSAVCVCILALISPLLVPNEVFCSQGVVAVASQTESDIAMLRKAERELQLLDSQKGKERKDLVARRAEKLLKIILELYTSTNLREQVVTKLSRVQEYLGMFHLQIARFYSNPGITKGMESHLLTITREYPNFSRMDEVLLLLGKVYVKWKQTKDAINYLRRLVCNYPSSKYVGEAFERLKQMGAEASEGCDRPQPQ